MEIPQILYFLGKRASWLAKTLNSVGFFIKISKFKGPRRSFGTFLEVFQQLFSNFKKDLILTDQTEYIPFAWILSKIYNVPLVVLARGDYYAEMQQKAKLVMRVGPAVKWLVKLNENLLKNGVFVITVSDYLKSRLLERFKIAPERIISIPESIDVNMPLINNVENVKTRLELPKAKFIFSVTNFKYPDKIKGMYLFLPGMKMLLEELPDLAWVIAGGGNYFKKFEKDIIKTFGNSKKVKLLGYVKDITDYYLSCEFFIHFSLLESFGRVIIEAQAFGKPVIANRFGGIPEMIKDGETGFLIEENCDQFLYFSRKLLTNKEIRQKMGANAKEYMRSHFNPIKIGNKWKTVLQEIICYSLKRKNF